MDILCAAVALHGILNIRECNTGVGVSLWPHLWPWVYFVHSHWEFLDGSSGPLSPLGTQQDFYIDYITCIRSFYDHSETLVLMTSTPFFWATMVKAWSFLTRVDHPEDRATMLIHIGEFVPDAQITKYPERLEEMIQEAGGSIDHIGAL
ncbi:hypothetical protein FB45DRAFT_1000374, partial [Roridomyces roridus]